MCHVPHGPTGAPYISPHSHCSTTLHLYIPGNSSLQPSPPEPTDLLYFSNFSLFHVQSEDISCSPSLSGHQPPCYDHTRLPRALQGCNSSEGPGQFFPSCLLIIVFAPESLWQRSTSLDQLLTTPKTASRDSQGCSFPLRSVSAFTSWVKSWLKQKNVSYCHAKPIEQCK